MIREIKIGTSIYQKISMGEENKIIPKDLEAFKAAAIDTINWKIGDSIKKALGNTNVTLSASNAKAVALLAKVVATLNPELDGLTELEADSYSKMIALADGGYANSNLLNASLSNVSDLVAAATDKVARVTKAQSIDEVIIILNED